MTQYYLFVIDTEQYAGNFYRELTAWCTGVAGESQVGQDESEAFQRATGTLRLPGLGCFPHSNGTVSTILPTPGWSLGDGCYRQDALGRDPAHLSVGICFEEMPSPTTIALLQQRALAYRPAWHTGAITITGFRLLRHAEREHLVASYPVPEPQL